MPGHARADPQGKPAASATSCSPHIANPAEFTFVEEWADQAAIDAHMATCTSKGPRRHTQPLLAEPLDVRLYTLA